MAPSNSYTSFEVKNKQRLSPKKRSSGRQTLDYVKPQ